MADDDFFSGDDLDDLPDNTFMELERNAISSTQLAKKAAAPTTTTTAAVARPLQRKQPHNASTLNRSQSAGKNMPWRPPQRKAVAPAPVKAPTAPPPSAPDPPSSDYGLDDENVIDLDEPSMIAQPVSRPLSRAATEQRSRTTSRSAPKPVLDPETEAAFAAADAELGAPRPNHWAQAPHLQHKDSNNADVSALQARVAELEAEQARLRKAEQDARNSVLAKQGEIAIVRANQEKAAKDYERRLSVMQRQHADEAARQKAEMEAGRKEREKMQTDNRFLQHDLAQESEKSKVNGTSKARAVSGTKERGTPKKSKRPALGDGFDDDEIRMVSPSRSKERSKDSTPKAGIKRKRSAQDDPVPALAFTQPSPQVRQESNDTVQVASEAPSVTAKPAEDERFGFMQLMLNHRSSEGAERSIELLSKRSWPSESTLSLASMILDNISLPAREGDHPLPLRMARILLEVWARCLAEKVYDSLELILDLLRFTLFFEPPSSALTPIEEAVPICSKTMELITLPLVQQSINPTWYATTATAKAVDERKKAEKHIDADDILEFMLQFCKSACLSAERIEAYWRCVSFQSALLMLNKAQPISRIHTALQMFTTSILPTTFGAINADAAQQASQERGTVDRLTSLLFDLPQAPKDEPGYLESEFAELRIDILKVLRKLCLNEHGGQLLAQNRNAIGRLVKFLHNQMCKLYTLPTSIGKSRLLVEPDQKSPVNIHDLVVSAINLATQILHQLLTQHTGLDINQKCAAVNGGFNKFLVGMTRIAFSEQLVLEAGIANEVSDAAQAILDLVLSPEEGDAIVKALETPKGTKGTGSTTRRNSSEPEHIDTDEPLQGAPD